MQARRHDEGQKSVEGRELQLFDVLINSTGVGTLGRVAQVWSLPERAIVDSRITVVRAAEGVNPVDFPDWNSTAGKLRLRRLVRDRQGKPNSAVCG